MEQPGVTVNTLHVSPARIELSNIIPGGVYEATVTLRNLAQRAQNIRVTAPRCVEFSLKGDASSIYAPCGLDKKVTVEFRPTEDRLYADVLNVKCGSDEIDIPVEARPPSADIVCRSQLDFGTVVLGYSSTKAITLKNEGTRGGRFSIFYDSALPIIITPTHGELEPGATLQVQVRLDGASVGAFVTEARIEVAGGVGATKAIELRGTIVSQTLQLVVPNTNQPLTALHFGTQYFGQKRVVSASLVNDSPHATSFKISIDSLKEDKQVLAFFPETKVEPSEGTVDPMSRLDVQFTFAPIEVDPQFASVIGSTLTSKAVFNAIRDYNRFATISVVESGQVVELPLTGKAVKAAIDVSQTSFNFGEAQVGEKLHGAFTLTNKNDELPVSFNMKKIAHFHTSPMAGKLQPLQAQEIIVTFMPKQIGAWKSVIDLAIAELMVVPIRVAGSSTPAPVPEAKVVQPLASGISRFPAIRSPPVANPAAAATYASGANNGRSTWRPPVEQLQQTAPRGAESGSGEIVVRQFPPIDFDFEPASASRYIDYIRSTHAARVQHKSQVKNVDQALDLGVESAATGVLGSNAHFTQLPAAGAPSSNGYFAQYKQMMDLKVQNMKAKETADSDTHFIKKKFKAKPTTQAEMRDCRTKLDRADLFQNVTAGNKVFDFGTVCVYSENARSLNITNSLKQSILVALVIEHEELSKSRPPSQVIPPGATAGFDIVFRSPTPQTFHDTISYTINGVHTYIITVNAEVTPILLDLSKEYFNFRFSPDTWQATVSDVLTLTNPAVHQAEFSIADGSSFRVKPNQGVLKPEGKMDLEIVFHPDSRVKYEETLVIKVNGGPDRAVRCVAKLNKVQCTASSKLVNFDVVAVGLSKRETLQLANTGQFDAFFYWDNPTAELSLSPSHGSIRAGATLDIALTLAPTKKQVYDIPVRLNTPGGASVHFQVRGRADVPTVSVKQDAFEFGEVYIGATARQRLTLENTATIAALVVVDVSQLPEFSLVLDTPAAQTALQQAQDNNNNSGGGGGDSADGIYKLHIEPDSHVDLSLMFKPNRLNKHDFFLPIHINGLPSSAMGKRVTAEALKSPLSLSKMSFDFGSQVVVGERSSMATAVLTAELKNDSPSTLRWQFGLDTPELAQGLFVLDPPRGTLEKGGGRATISVTFVPREKRRYATTVPVYLDGDDRRVFLEFDLAGTGTAPMLSFNTREVVLPVVPLGIKSTAVFIIKNQGYHKLDLQYKLPLDKDAVPISVSFPRGTVVDNDENTELPVEVSAVCTRPLSFAGRIDFFDADGQKFGLVVSGGSDNSVLSVFSFLDSEADSLAIVASKKGKEINVEYRDQGDSKAHSPHAGVELVDWIMQFGVNRGSSEPPAIPDAVSAKSRAALMNWLNVSALKTAMTDFPGEFVRSDGRLLVDLVEGLAGRKIPFPSPDKTGGVSPLLQRLETVLRFLRANGAVLGAVRAEFLLDLDEFVKASSSQQLPLLPAGVGGMGQQQRTLLQRDYPKLSAFAWAVVVYQAIKLFALGRVTLKGFRSLPGIKGTKTGQVMPASNVYSVAETVLLKWLTVSSKKADGSSKRQVVNFERDLSDGVVLAAVILAHVPSVSRLARIHRHPSDREQASQNAANVVAAVKDIGLEYAISAKDILEPHAPDMLLFVLFLYQNLPQFIPRSAIDFRGSLQQEVIKELELANPSSQAVYYTVTLDGSTDFVLSERTVHLEPKSTKSYTVKFISRFSRPAEARLTFYSRGKGTAAASVLVFLLRAVVESQKPIKIFDYEGSLYERQELTISVANPLPAAGKFQISVSQETTLPVGKDGRTLFVEKGSSQGKPELPESFICMYDSLALGGGGEKANISLQFAPLFMGVHVCRLLFVDADVGEFAYEVSVTVGLPDTLERVRLSCEERNVADRKIALPFVNPQAVSMLQKLSAEFEGTRAQASVRKILASSKFVNPDQLPPSVSFKVEYSPTSPLSGPTEVTLHADPAAAGNVLPVVFKPKEAASYASRVLLYANATGDVRVIELEGVATPRTTTQSLTFSAAARQSVLQQVPIGNAGGKDWRLRATLSSGSKAFSGPPELLVPAGKMVNYPLVFKPNWIGSFTGTLTLSETNRACGDFVFNLKGTGEDPLPEDNIRIETQAKTKTPVHLLVKNPYTYPVDYRVTSDVPYVSGPGIVSLAPGQSSRYTLSVNPQCSGTFHGVVTFTMNSGEYHFYQLQVTASLPPPEQADIEVRTEVRKPVAAEITINNPLPSAVEFEVTYEGDGLFGDTSLTVGPQQSVVHSAIFYPLVPGEQRGSIMFFSESVGESWYQLLLVADPTAPVTLPEMQAEVGKNGDQVVRLENPTERTVTLSVNNSNPHVFECLPPELVLQPFETVDVHIVYSPSSVGEVETGTFVFSHPLLGEWIYHCSGKGLEPTVMDTTIVIAGLGESVSDSISFTNPFNKPTKLSISLGGANEESAFQLQGPAEVDVEPFGQIVVPFSFRPSSMAREYSCTVFVRAHQGPRWRYPVKGIPELDTGQTLQLRCQARTRLERHVELQLPQLTLTAADQLHLRSAPAVGDGALFSEEILCKGDNPLAIERALIVQHVATTPSQPGVGATVSLAFDITLYPLRTIDGAADLIIKKRDGGRFVYKLDIQVTPAAVDDEIVISAMPGKTSGVAFRLVNQFDRALPFTARFSPESAREFSVSPSEGVMQPFKEDDDDDAQPSASKQQQEAAGVLFKVAFRAPTVPLLEPLRGMLIIQNAEMEWSYSVAGMQPTRDH